MENPYITSVNSSVPTINGNPLPPPGSWKNPYAGNTGNSNSVVPDDAGAPKAAPPSEEDLSWLFDYNQATTQGISSIGDRENQWLEQIRKYDPNAQWKFIDNSGSSNENGQVAPNVWTMDFDHTKLPSPGNPITPDGTYQGFNPQGDYFSIGQYDPSVDYKNPDFHWSSPYGELTDPRNVQESNERRIMQVVGPLLVSLAGGLPALASGGGLASLFSGGNAAFNAVSGILRGLSQGNLNLSSLAGLIPGLPPELATLLRLGMNATGTGNIRIDKP